MDKQVSHKDFKAVIPQLPLELIVKIIDYFPEKSDVHGRLDAPLGRQLMLSSMSRVCRHWREITIPLLFRAPRIISLRQAGKLCLCLQRRKYLRKIVRDLNWPLSQRLNYFSQTKLGEVGRTLIYLCPNLEEMIVWLLRNRPSGDVVRCFLDIILNSRRQLKKLALKYLGRRHDRDIISIPSNFSHLELLDLTGTKINLRTVLLLLHECKHLPKLILQKRFDPAEMAEIQRAKPPHLVIRYRS
ncbi:hypothetical protein DFS34DRAFT_317798 [Phlyctochytrium arcticum]|nr:hypothetical protein DFS34DRAFT_317798 [Phlyctochytrium arcticum]